MAYDPKLELVDILNTCALKCDNCVDGCLLEKSAHSLVLCIKVNIDCSAVCRLTASLISRDSPVSSDVLGFCAIVCETCATECEKHSSLVYCQLSADACRACKEICLQHIDSINSLKRDSF